MVLDGGWNFRSGRGSYITPFRAVANHLREKIADTRAVAARRRIRRVASQVSGV
jgi:hypothetical protein